VNPINVSATVSVFSTYILPAMFGLLGTLVAAFRLIYDKIRDDLLSPRDLVLVLTSLPIGAIAGLAVGLFFRSTEETITAIQGLPSSISLSVAGLAFLTGYAADAFFSFLDSLRGQVFRATNPPPGADAAAYRTERVAEVALPAMGSAGGGGAAGSGVG
jgi:hypothetical protein